MANATETTVIPIRLPVSRLKMLEAIQREKGHRFRNTTLNEAVDQYVERYLRETGKADADAGSELPEAA